MRHYSAFFIVLFFVLPFAGLSQNITLTGKVKDAQTKEGLPSCNIFINNSTVGTNTDLEGNYSLSGLSQTEFEVVFSYVGYISSTKKIIAKAGETINLDVELKPSNNLLTEVEVKSKRDKKWEKQLKKFRNVFFGYSNFAEKCEIENAWVLDFEEKEEGFYAKASQPLLIKNNATGYNISFELIEFFSGKESYKIGGNARFVEQTPANKAKLDEWFANRAIAYKNSPIFLFKSLVDNKLEENGFDLYIAKPGSSDVRTDNFENELGKTVIPYESKKMVNLGNRPEIKKIYIVDNLEVHNQSVRSEVKTYRGHDAAVSWMQVRGNNVYVDNKGVPINHRDIIVSGDMDYLKASGFLPTDYDPKSSSNEAYFLKFEKPALVEKPHLHLDRPSYYQGERVWFKGYINYNLKNGVDSSSKVLYVQLLSPEGSIVENLKYEVSNGFTYGDFSIPNDILPGIYRVRAYTNYMRNFDSGLFFETEIPVLRKTEEITMISESVPSNVEDKVNISINKNDSLAIHKSMLNFHFQNEKGKPIRVNFSVSVTNPNYSQDLGFTKSIEQDYPIPANFDSKKSLKKFEIEKGLKIEGTFLDKKRNPATGKFNAIFNGFEKIEEGEANPNGKFVLNNLLFYGENTIYFQPTNKKQNENIFVINSSQSQPEVKAFRTTQVEYKTDTKVNIFEDIVKAKISQKDSVKKDGRELKMIYGSPDYVISGKNLIRNNGINGIVNSLTGRIPNFKYSQGMFIIRGGTSSIFNSPAALVLVDGIASASWTNLNPFNIDKIEVVSRMSNMYGDQGRNGIVSFFTKDKNSEDDELVGKGFTKLELNGLEVPKAFEPAKIKMAKNENKPTIFWNPENISDEKGNSNIVFPVDYFGEKIKIVVEGITENNIPFWRVFYLK